MKKLNKKRTIIISVLFLSIFILGFFQNAKISKAQPQYNEVTKTLTTPLSFSMYEFSEDIENKENITSIDISLHSPLWNLTDIQVNFTDIDFNRETLEIETAPKDSRSLGYYFFEALSVQINITDPTLLYGVQLYGSSIKPDDEDVYVQIRGYDSNLNRPNDTLYLSEKINMSGHGETWYIQEFNNPILLSKGNYSLVINATDIMSASDKSTEYRWHFNSDDPNNPDLYVSFFDKDLGIWSSGFQGAPFLYKLDQKLNFSFKPEDINMHAEIDGDSFPVTEGVGPIKGELSIPNVDYSSATYTLPISIKNNKSSSLLFNATYRYKLKHILNSGGTVSIKESFNNTWTINPNFTRPSNNPSNNYSIKFEYPISWFNLTVFNSTGELIESIDYVDDGEAIYILNDTITTDTGWKITANSEKVSFNADPQLESYIPGQLLKIPITLPPSIEKTNLTVVLLDRDGYFEYNYTEEDPSGPSGIYIFEYLIPLNVIGGTWTALIFWNNFTDAGLERTTFLISVTSENGDGGGSSSSDKTVITGVDPQLIYMTVLYIIIGSLVGLSSYKMVKRHKRAKAEHREKIFNKYMDLLNLDYIMISDKKSGLNVYEQILAGKERDISLIGGFLQAIRSFGIELSGSEAESQTIRLQYQNMNIIMNDFKNFRILNVMKEPPSQDFLDSLRPLSHDIEMYYGKSLKDFDGHVAKFRGIKDLLEEHLQTPLIYPLKVVMTKETKLNSAEKSLANKALSIMKKNNVDHFFVSYLMGKAKEFNVKNAEIILKLIEKKVFRPIE